MKVYRDIEKKERYWIEKVLEVEFKENQLLLRQALKSKVILEQGYDFISLRFKTKEKEKYPYPVRVPVEMRAFQNDSVPIVFLLHIINGFINELELVTADSSKIDIETIELDNVEYVINESVREF